MSQETSAPIAARELHDAVKELGDIVRQRLESQQSVRRGVVASPPRYNATLNFGAQKPLAIPKPPTQDSTASPTSILGTMNGRMTANGKIIFIPPKPEKLHPAYPLGTPLDPIFTSETEMLRTQYNRKAPWDKSPVWRPVGRDSAGAVFGTVNSSSSQDRAQTSISRSRVNGDPSSGTPNFDKETLADYQVHDKLSHMNAAALGLPVRNLLEPSTTTMKTAMVTHALTEVRGTPTKSLAESNAIQSPSGLSDGNASSGSTPNRTSHRFHVHQKSLLDVPTTILNESKKTVHAEAQAMLQASVDRNTRSSLQQRHPAHPPRLPTKPFETEAVEEYVDDFYRWSVDRKREVRCGYLMSKLQANNLVPPVTVDHMGTPRIHTSRRRFLDQ